METNIDNVTIITTIKYAIDVNTEIGQFCDALYYPLEEWKNLTSEELGIIITKRADSWVELVNTLSKV